MPWRDGVQIQRVLETTFKRILNKRMQGLPLVNHAIDVQSLDFRRFQQNWVGILITPWFMNLLLLPTAESGWCSLTPGQKFSCRFPHGEFEFIVAVEPDLGRYASCSLYSPMFQFDRQNVAVATAQSAWQALFIDDEKAETLAKAGESHGISRRNLLRGAIAKRNQRP